MRLDIIVSPKDLKSRTGFFQGITERKGWILIFWSIIVLWCLLFNLNFASDGERYYAYLRSCFFDHDLNFYNEYTFYTFTPAAHKSDFLTRTATGYIGNSFSIGPALLWTPFFMVGHLCVKLAQLSKYQILANGYSFPYLLLTGLGTLFYSLLGLYSCYRMSRLFFSESIALVSVFLIYLSSPAPAYIFREPAFSHSMSFAMISLYLYIWISERGAESDHSVWKLLLLGALGGIATLVRWQNSVILLIFLVDHVHRFWTSGRHREGRDFKKGLALPVFLFALSAGLWILPQLITWKILFGSLVTIPEGKDFMIWTSPGFLKALFSPVNGFFIWHPLLLPAVLGLLVFWRKHRVLALSGIIFFIFQCYVNGAVHDWFAGVSFGNRRLINTLPFLMLGFGALLERLTSRVRVGLLAFVTLFPLWNLILLVRSYGGDLIGLKGLNWELAFTGASMWLEMFVRFLGANYLLFQLKDAPDWAISWFRFFLPLGLVLVCLLYYAFFSRLQSRAEPRFTGNIYKLVTIVILALGLGLNIFLAGLGIGAETIFTIHLGNDAFGRAAPLRIASAEYYMGSLTPFHLDSGETKSVPFMSEHKFSKIWLVATLSGAGFPRQELSSALEITVTTNLGAKLAHSFTYPDQIGRMDKDEFRFNHRFAPRVVSSWFGAPGQKRPHHWYGLTVDFGKAHRIVSIHITNLCPDMKLHVTGIACQ